MDQYKGAWFRVFDQLTESFPDWLESEDLDLTGCDKAVLAIQSAADRIKNLEELVNDLYNQIADLQQ